MVKEFGALPVARDAAAMLAKSGADPAIQKEKSAEAAYVTTMLRLEKASKRDRPGLLNELGKLAKKYEGTKYGQLAAEAGQSDGKAQ